MAREGKTIIVHLGKIKTKRYGYNTCYDLPILGDFLTLQCKVDVVSLMNVMQHELEYCVF